MDDIFVSGTNQEPRGRDDKADSEKYKKKVSKGRKRKQNPKMMENSQKVDAIQDNALNQNISRFTEEKKDKRKQRMTEQLYNITNKTLINME